MTDDSDPVAQLTDLLREADARPTLDPARNATHPCVRCATTTEPRELVAIGVYTRPMGGGLRPGDKIVRPLCAACREATQPALAARSGELKIWLTVEQIRDFTACATICGRTLERWIIECAAVQAAAVIDARQADARQRRAGSLGDNEALNARNRDRRRAVRLGSREP